VLSIFEIGSLQLFCSGWHWTMALLISASQVDRITGVSHWCLASSCITFFFFFCSTGVWTQGLHFEPFHPPFFVIGFFKLGLWNCLPGLASDRDPPDLWLLSS
jgi:hypothetical protein